MKALLTVGALFAVLFAFYYVIDVIVGLGMDPIGEAEWTPDQAKAIADGYAVVPPVRR